MSETGRRPTQKDVAKLAGVHRASVSLALKNHPSIPEKTRLRIVRAAAKIGYVPDPMLSALVAYRGRNRPRAFQGAMAWLVDSRGGTYDWKQEAIFRGYFQGARQRARENGFALEAFDLGTQGMTTSRMASILRSRNIRGLLLSPQPEPNTEMAFPWDGFSPVTFGYTLAKPQLHTVTATQYRAMTETVRRLRGAGYRRIAFSFSMQHDERADHNYLAGYLAEQFLAGQAALVPAESYAEVDPRQFKKWFLKHRPDAIVTGNQHVLAMLGEAGLRAPRDLGAACPLLSDADGPLAGFYEDPFHIGQVAVDFATAMIQRGEMGVPARPQRVHVEGVWNPGTTLRAAA